MASSVPEGLDRLGFEALFHSRWPDRERRAECALFGTKWWDYRAMHPVEATYLFSETLDEELRAIIRGHLDDRPPRVTATGAVLDWHMVKAGDVLEPPRDPRRQPYWARKIAGLIRARQAADADGIPYRHFCRHGLRFLYFGAGTYMLQRARIPEPNLLYGEGPLLHIRETWLEALRARVQTAEHPRYKSPARGEDPDADAHRAWIISQSLGRPEPERPLVRLVREGFLTESEAQAAARDPERFSRLMRRPG